MKETRETRIKFEVEFTLRENEDELIVIENYKHKGKDVKSVIYYFTPQGAYITAGKTQLHKSEFDEELFNTLKTVAIDYVNHPAIPLNTKLTFLLRYIKPYFLNSKTGRKVLQNLLKALTNAKEIKKEVKKDEKPKKASLINTS